MVPADMCPCAGPCMGEQCGGQLAPFISAARAALAWGWCGLEPSVQASVPCWVHSGHQKRDVSRQDMMAGWVSQLGPGSPGPGVTVLEKSPQPAHWGWAVKLEPGLCVPSQAATAEHSTAGGWEWPGLAEFSPLVPTLCLQHPHPPVSVRGRSRGDKSLSLPSPGKLPCAQNQPPAPLITLPSLASPSFSPDEGEQQGIQLEMK